MSSATLVRATTTSLRAGAPGVARPGGGHKTHHQRRGGGPVSGGVFWRGGAAMTNARQATSEARCSMLGRGSGDMGSTLAGGSPPRQALCE